MGLLLGGCDWVGFFALNPEAQAAWAQAILTVITFAVTLGIGLRQRSVENNRLRRAENSKARDLALPVVKAVDAWADRFRLLSNLVVNGHPEMALIDYRRTGARMIPPEVLALEGKIHHLADVAPKLQFAIYWLRVLETRLPEFDWYENYAARQGQGAVPEVEHARARQLEADLGLRIAEVGLAIFGTRESLHELFK